MSRIAILGAGSWGTALAIVLSRASHPHEIWLWTRDANDAQSISRSKENRKYLPTIPVPAAIRVTHSMGEALRSASIVIGAMPSAHARTVYSAAADAIGTDPIVVSATKGLEPGTHARMSEVIASSLPRARVAVLSGPSFALEVAKGTPTAVVIAAADAALASDLQEQFAAPNFRLYSNDDVLGVELAAAMKNVIAIAAGTCQGLGLGANTLAALITRGLAEMGRLAAAVGARPETLNGLAGLGDLVLTCNGSLSRNRQVGIELARGRPLGEIIVGISGVAEGVDTVKPLLALAKEHKVELPITTQVEAILSGDQNPRAAIREIMERPQKRE
ncbi:MAG: NAD(P)-dependent glycerol-3-phosphate dehydrogenase [Acidobacteria bacterium]|nr:NAD(P)-dependent glycerol-3-phosphate dehydrogenase [Acidobacteriota bacterium]